MSGSDEIAGEPPKYDNYLNVYKAFWVCGAQSEFQGLGRYGQSSRTEFIEVLAMDDEDITTMTTCPICTRGKSSGYGCGWYTFTPFDFYK